MSDIRAFDGLVELSSAALGGRALACSDDFFAAMDHLLEPKPARFDPTTYTDRGKEMDGWESRRRRTPGHDWCVIRLGVPGVLRGVDIDTSHFLGNHPPFASLEATVAPADATPEHLEDEAAWDVVLPEVALQRGSHNLHALRTERAYTHVRLHIYPDGGVARLRVYGDPAPALGDGEIDLASLANGARTLVCSDMFFSPMHQLLLPDRSRYMGGGWETRRSRPPGEDWIVVRLAAPGAIRRAVIDTAHFKGNYPDRAALDGLYWPDAPASALIRHPDWREILSPKKLHADREHSFDLVDPGPFTHVRLRILPDGGVARLRLFGHVVTEAPAEHDALLRRLNGATDDDAAAMLTRCCGSRRWVAAMLARRPFRSRTELFGEAERAWWHLGRKDWLEAFAHHPRIGADVEALRAKFATTADWSRGEQAGVAAASEETLRGLADGNVAYEQRFGFLFIVCATGLSADEMLGRLRERLDNTPEAELRIAAGEHAKITRLRLAKLESP